MTAKERVERGDFLMQMLWDKCFVNHPSGTMKWYESIKDLHVYRMDMLRKGVLCAMFGSLDAAYYVCNEYGIDFDAIKVSHGFVPCNNPNDHRALTEQWVLCVANHWIEDEPVIRCIIDKSEEDGMLHVELF